MGIGLTLAALWVLTVLAMVLSRPGGIDLQEARRFVPDVLLLVKRLAADPTTSPGVRRRLRFLAVYLALPIDLVPDFLPVLGYLDDAMMVVITLRSVMRRAGPAALQAHWPGTPAGLAAVRRLAGVPSNRRDSGNLDGDRPT